MDNFQLQREGFERATSIPNSFIEDYMPTAAGEFVKIYIYLVKCINENCSELSISRLADVFNNTEKDTVRALKYWQKKGLLKLSFDGNGALTSLTLTSAGYDSAQPTQVTSAAPQAGDAVAQAASDAADAPDKSAQDSVVSSAETVQGSTQASGISSAESVKSNTIPFPEQKQYSKSELDKFAGDTENSLLIYSIQKYVGRALTGNDINTIMFFEETLGFDNELIEYVFEYCANIRKTNIRYIEKTAISWAEKGIKSASAAKLLNAIYSENCYPVMKAFGLTGRYPAREETAFIDRWVLSYGFPLSIILEACNRTINTIHQPSFEYADSILSRWKKLAVKDLKDIEALDKEHEARSASAKASDASRKKTAKAGTSGFNNFQQREYDYEEIEDALLGKLV